MQLGGAGPSSGPAGVGRKHCRSHGPPRPPCFPGAASYTCCPACVTGAALACACRARPWRHPLQAAQAADDHEQVEITERQGTGQITFIWDCFFNHALPHVYDDHSSIISPQRLRGEAGLRSSSKRHALLALPSPLGRRREAVSLDHQHVRLLKGLARNYALPCGRRHNQRVHGHKVVQVHLRAPHNPLCSMSGDSDCQRGARVRQQQALP